MPLHRLDAAPFEERFDFNLGRRTARHAIQPLRASGRARKHRDFTTC
jgi:hypothetical protein